MRSIPSWVHSISPPNYLVHMFSLLLVEKCLVKKWSIISRTILLCPFLSRYDSPSPLANYSDLRPSFVNLQENYLKPQPARVRNLDGPEKTLKELQLMERAAASISDGDLIDAIIHGFVHVPMKKYIDFTTPDTNLYLEAWATLGIDATSRSMLNCQTSFLPLWDGSTLRRPQCNVISAVRE